MQDLNDLFYFVQVVDHAGFAPAGRALGVQKSKLSRRILLLEERLGVRLLNQHRRAAIVIFAADFGDRESARRSWSRRKAPNRWLPKCARNRAASSG
jgi:Bacterial regulatory helix-turn-helix protein, lysR family